MKKKFKSGDRIKAYGPTCAASYSWAYGNFDSEWKGTVLKAGGNRVMFKADNMAEERVAHIKQCYLLVKKKAKK